MGKQKIKEEVNQPVLLKQTDRLISAVQYHPSMEKLNRLPELCYVAGMHPFLKTVRGNIVVLPGDWVVTEQFNRVQGERIAQIITTICPQEEFPLRYEPLSQPE